jgi:Cdc6-like AAA superfamily ATPase
MSDQLAHMNIEPTLKYLLTRPDPFICLVKGQWGVGKTYFIKKFIRENRAVIAKSNFAYVSLFGISNIEELVQAIFVNSISTKTLDTTLSDALSSDEALTTRAKYLLDRVKPLLSRAGGLPIFGVNAMRGFTVGTMAHFFNRNSLIVIDDLERHSAGLSVRDILGVITQLKEERGCQIIIVMNEDALTKDSDAPYFAADRKSPVL